MRIRAFVTATALAAVTTLCGVTALDPSGPARAETPPSSVDPSADPAVVAALESAWYEGYSDAWGREGGVRTDRAGVRNAPIGSADSGPLARSTSRIVLDVRHRRFLRSTHLVDSVPTHVIESGGTRYARTAPVIRRALRLHHAPSPAWTSARILAAPGQGDYEIATGEIYRPAASPVSSYPWVRLSASTDQRGHTTYTGAYIDDSAPELGGTATVDIVVDVDAHGRPVSWNEAAEDGIETRHISWAWSRPTITLPTVRNHAHAVVKRELGTHDRAQSYATAENARATRLHRPVTAHRLQARYHFAQYHTSPIANGIRVTEHALGHAFSWKVVVERGRAVVSPMRNRTARALRSDGRGSS